MGDRPFEDQLTAAAIAVYERLSEQTPPPRIVLAESCTGGLVAATLVQVPGISQFFCGSSVVYRPETKTAWLGVPPSLIEQHTAESAQITTALASAALARTPEATLAAAVTGHLQADPNRVQPQPHIFISMAHSADADSASIAESHFVLLSEDRKLRQQEAALRVLACLIEVIRST